ncbi:MAG: hypothetical protein MIO92_13040, partial [Methanosarcinaceae archaeon]|nr:hypothetical protein [Methanosarcinaceae archaeon]
ISRSSAMTFKGTKRSIPEIAKSVNVKYVLEGSVRKAGNSLRIIAQLIDATNDVHLWAEKYSGTMDDIFDIQEKVSRKIVEALKGRITPEDGQQLSSRPSVTDIGVYEAYARARFEFWKMDPGCNEKALHILEEAIIAYGEHPLLLSGIGAIHWQFYHMLGDLDDAHLKKIEECTVKLFAADPASSYGHRLTSYLCMLAGQTPVAIDHLRQAMNADPNDTETLLWLSYLLASHAGRPLIAKPVADRWLAIDPLNPFSSASSMWVHWASGDLVNALKSVEEWCLRDPGNRIGAWYRCQLLAWVGRYEESYRLADALTKEDPNEVMGQILRCLILALQGRKDEAFHTVSEENLAHAWIDFGLPCIMAECYALMEEKDEALRWLERAVEKGLFNYPSINEFDPFLSNIRYEERFKKLMERVKYKWENFEV